MSKLFSIVIPVFNEESNLGPLILDIFSALSLYDESNFEIITVDDASTDRSLKELRRLGDENETLTVISFKKRSGQTAAMMAGAKEAKGDLIVFMDGDRQNDPKDIPKLINAISEDVDVVSGWRKKRKDSFFKRIFLSSLANRLISSSMGLKLNDYGCSLKVFKSEVLKPLKIYGEMHRFLPLFCFWNGATIKEVEVGHHPRLEGESKYGVERVYKVLLDLLFLRFLVKYSHRPLHFFGKFGLYSILAGIGIFSFVIYRKLILNGQWISPLLIVSFFMTGIGFVMVLIGILAEMMIRLNEDGPQFYGRPPYDIFR
ncbi:glycosyltransferase family 2 protein [bacterium]|jgi:glycosyltransferase involved in cell wall biosynthesis|nr:glycosyltransferase family 2 protein [bacterium]